MQLLVNNISIVNFSISCFGHVVALLFTYLFLTMLDTVGEQRWKALIYHILHKWDFIESLGLKWHW